ncbi:hypothetical protein QCA50_018072 [Cerrena zonata]|uniref:Uncharacterized protein n=1 Tax=Cerrena zonata TaxID=2478898 RepID=A0AAW0FHX2_9APHY
MSMAFRMHCGSAIKCQMNLTHICGFYVLSEPALTAFWAEPDPIGECKIVALAATIRVPPPETTIPVEGSDDEDTSGEPDIPWVSDYPPGDAADGEENTTSCAETWKASAAEREERALDISEATGLFVSACDHGFIQVVRSGEL